MPPISIMCVYSLPMDPSLLWYKHMAMDAARKASYIAEARMNARKDKFMLKKSCDSWFHEKNGFWVQYLDVELVFVDKESWDYYHKPANFLTLYKEFDDYIKATYGKQWAVVKNKFKPDYPKKYVKDDYTQQDMLVIRYVNPSKPPAPDPDELD